MTKKWRKPRPEPPPYFFFANDNCWFCKNRNNCSGCKALKQAVAHQKENKRKERRREGNLYEN